MHKSKKFHSINRRNTLFVKVLYIPIDLTQVEGESWRTRKCSMFWKLWTRLTFPKIRYMLSQDSRKWLWCHFQVFAILSHLPRRRNGKIQVDEFINLPIISEDAFKAIDRNKDGFLTRGELKMSNKSASMGEVGEVREGKANIEAFTSNFCRW